MHTSAHTKRITITLETYLFERVKQTVGEASVSSFIAQAVEDKLLQPLNQALSPDEAFEEMCKIGDTQPMTREKIRRAIEDGRV